jgi:D-alanyl-D-alanine carboxypeptidase/D-alanyl-D-alanine endopeptidase (penicillin-binding protein 7)
VQEAENLCQPAVSSPSQLRASSAKYLSNPVFEYLLLLFVTVCYSQSWGAVAFESAHAIVVDEGTDEVLLEKDSDAAAPIASLTKLMTAMVVLDAHQDPDEFVRITDADIDRLKHTRSGVSVGTILPRRTLLKLALMSSDNHAAAALARNYPGGLDAFSAATQQKIADLGLDHTALAEPTGLSPSNQASAADLVKVLRAASTYPEIAEITTQSKDVVDVNGRLQEFHNTNSLVSQSGWTILLSKTGYTNEAGRCLAMRMEAAGRTVLVVLMGAVSSPKRALDALNIHRWLTGQQPLLAQRVPAVRRTQATRRVGEQVRMVRSTSTSGS